MLRFRNTHHYTASRVPPHELQPTPNWLKVGWKIYPKFKIWEKYRIFTLEPATKAVWAFCSSSVGRDRTYVQLGNNADYCCRMPTNLTSSLPMTRWDQDTAFKRLTEFADQLPLPDMVGTFIWLKRSAMLLRLREPSGSIFCSIATLSLQGVCIAPYGPLRPS